MRNRLPRSGSDTDHLARALKRADVWRLLFAYAHCALGSADVYERLDAIKVRVEPGQLEQLFQLALSQAKAVGR